MGAGYHLLLSKIDLVILLLWQQQFIGFHTLAVCQWSRNAV